MKKYFFMAVAAVAVLSSCSEELTKENENISDDNTLVFTATIESDGATRTTLVNNYPNWEANDVVNINGATYTAIPDGNNATKATLSYYGGTKPTTTPYIAYYPASLYNDGTPTLPGTYTYAPGEFNMPMYAESNTTSLGFVNICAVLAVKVTSADMTTLKSIKVKSDKAMCGAFAVTGNAAMLADDSDATKAVVLNCEVTLDETGTIFYIPIPAQEYSYLTIYLSADGTNYYECMSTKKADGLGELARNTIYNIDYEKNAVQMYADGPYWATMNVGATSPEDYGDYFAWGETEGYNQNEDHTFGWSTYKWCSGSTYDTQTKYCTNKSYGTVDNKTELELPDDAAHANWGGSWRMPKFTQIEELLSENCTREWATQSGVNGLLVTSKNNSAQIFLPAAGCRNDAGLQQNGSEGNYWTSTLLSDYNDDANKLYFLSSHWGYTYGLRYVGQSVRAVCQ